MTPASAGSAKRRDTAGGSIAEGDNIAVRRQADAPTLTSILDGLTDAQKRAIVRLGDPGLIYGGLFRTGLSASEEIQLKEAGLVHWSPAPGAQGIVCRLTPLGQQIRTALLETEK